MKSTVSLLLTLAVPCLASPLQEVIPVSCPITNRMLFVIDVSDSMRGAAMEHARNCLLELAGVPTDDLEFAVLAFNNHAYRWPGIPGAGAPERWAALPSEEALLSAHEWIDSLEPSGDTHGVNALSIALSEPVDNLTIVVITDGKFNGPDDNNIVRDVQAFQDFRVSERGLSRAGIVVVGVGTYCASDERLRALGAGGLFVVSTSD